MPLKKCCQYEGFGEQLLLLARGDSNRMPLQIGRIDLADTAQTVLKEFRMIAKDMSLFLMLSQRMWKEMRVLLSRRCGFSWIMR